MHLRVDSGTTASTAGLNLTLTLHDPVTTRAAFDDSLNPGGRLTSTAGSTISAPFDTLAVDADGNRVFSVALQTATEQTADRLAARRPEGGVYPLEVQLRDADDKQVDGFVTHVVVANVVAGSVDAGTPTLAASRPLDVAWVWPLATEPAYLPDGTPDPAVVDAAGAVRPSRPAGGDDRLADRPAAHARALTGDARRVARLRPPTRRSRHRDHRRAAGCGARSRSWPARSCRSTCPRSPPRASRAPSTPSSRAAPRPSTACSAPASILVLRCPGRSTSTLRSSSASAASTASILDDPGALSPATETFTPAHPYTVQATPGDDSTTMTVVVADAGIQRAARGDEPPALRAAHVLAALAFIEREQPSLTRGVAIVNPSRWDAPQRAARRARGRAPQEPVRPRHHRRRPDRRRPGGRRARAHVPDPRVHDRRAGHREGVRSRLPQPRRDQRPVRPRPTPRVARGERALFSSLTSTWQNTGGTGEGARRCSPSIGTSANDFLSRIRIPSSTTVTITSSRAEIPITFRNDTDQKVSVHVTLESDKLLFPDGNERDLELPPRSTTARFTVETRSSGHVPRERHGHHRRATSRSRARSSACGRRS